MCGIAGGFARAGAPPDDAMLGRMLDAIRHRGPDDEGRYRDAHVALGTRRLSIIDVEGGHQPLSNEDDTVWAAFNGEIYNYRELRVELEARGHRFRTHGDTEMLVHLWEDDGPELLHRLNGMFVFALWDIPRRRLMLARDRLGIKPLYWAEAGGTLLFGSEMKAVLASGLVARDLDLGAVRDYLRLQYVPAPGGIFKGVRKLLPGERLLAEADGVRVETYWTPPAEPLAERPLEEDVERFTTLFSDAVALQMRSDVPYGAFLSGGIDSSAVVGTMTSLESRPVRTFAIGFEGSAYYDERPWARKVAQLFGTTHEEFVVRPDVFSLMDELAWLYDEPFADAALLPSVVLAGLTRKHVKVVLTGDGGDELFAGYDRYRSEVLAEEVRRLPALLRTGVMQPLLRLYRGPGDWRLSDAVRQAQRKLELLALDPEERYVRHFEAIPPELLARIASDTLMAAPATEAAGWARAEMAAGARLDFLNRRLRYDVRTWLPDQMLTKVDRATMGRSLEARVPFLDHRLVEFAMGLPQERKLTLRTMKRFLKTALAGMLPADVLHRRKHGFQVPVDEWLRGPLREMAREELSPAALSAHGLFRPQPITAMLDEHEAGRRNWSKELFVLLVFQSWYRRWVANPA